MNAMTRDFPMPIVTTRLILRPVQISDASHINEAVLESFDILHEFMDWAKTMPSIEDTQEYAGLAASSWINKSPEEPWLQLAITCDKDNARSKNIPERLGYVLEATLKNHRRKPMSGELSDTLVYARYDCNEMAELEVTWGNN